VDTGMGFERVTAVLQGKSSNYDTDVFTPLFQAIRDRTGARPYGGKLDDKIDTAYRGVADHICTLTFALTDGAVPGREGRDYVLRRILRRAERYGRQYLGTDKPFLCELVPAVVDAMGNAFPELKRHPNRVAQLIKEEEVSFIRTLDRGIKLFQEVAAVARVGEGPEWEGKKVIPGDQAFKLHDTYGLYIDITEQMADEVGMKVDRPGFEAEMQKAKARARGARKRHTVTAVKGELPKTDESPKYEGLTATAKVMAWVKDSTVGQSGRVNEGEEVALLLDRTCFYAEQG